MQIYVTAKKEGDAFSEVKHEHDNPMTSFECAHVEKSIIYVTMHKQKSPANILSRKKHKKLLLQTWRKTISLF